MGNCCKSGAWQGSSGAWFCGAGRSPRNSGLLSIRPYVGIDPSGPACSWFPGARSGGRGAQDHDSPNRASASTAGCAHMSALVHAVRRAVHGLGRKSAVVSGPCPGSGACCRHAWLGGEAPPRALSWRVSPALAGLNGLARSLAAPPHGPGKWSWRSRRAGGLWVPSRNVCAGQKANACTSAARGVDASTCGGECVRGVGSALRSAVVGVVRMSCLCARFSVSVVVCAGGRSGSRPGACAVV